MNDLVFYDGSCGFCHRAVRFFVLRDGEGHLRFAPRGGVLFDETFSAEERAALPESMVIRTPDGRTFLKSSGTVYLLRRLGGVWAVAGWLLWLIPRPLRNVGYSVVARVRHRLYAAPESVCPVVPAELRGRFVA